ncbi:MAG TPA: hypothetical protein PL110_05515 [Candidatus Eremiobacteraeota bacterium]|nr:MAG: ABC-2 family transporter protein [bacterium ADurb.Bin363]HPZ07550.1 hypothetical protein [Candidatus Eremiobacteraeota bacterium]
MLKRLILLIAKYIWENPIFTTELSRRLRNNKIFIIQIIYLSILSVIFYAIWVDHTSYNYYDPSRVSYIMFKVALFVLSILMALICPAFTCSDISSEIEKKTFDLLITSLLDPAEIVAGKLNSTVVFLALLLFSSIPITSSIFLFGGISYVDLLMGYLFILFITVMLCMIGLFISARTRNTNISIGLTYSCTFVMFIFTMILLEETSSFSFFTDSIDFYIVKIPFSLVFFLEFLYVFLLLFLSTASLIERPLQGKSLARIRKLFSLFYIMNVFLLILLFCAHSNLSANVWTLVGFFHMFLFFLLILFPFFIWNPDLSCVYKKYHRIEAIFWTNNRFSSFFIPFLAIPGLIIANVVFLYFYSGSNLSQMISASGVVLIFIYAMAVLGKWISTFMEKEEHFMFTILGLSWGSFIISGIVRRINYTLRTSLLEDLLDPFVAIENIWKGSGLNPLYLVLFYCGLALLCHILIYKKWPFWKK